MLLAGRLACRPGSWGWRSRPPGSHLWPRPLPRPWRGRLRLVQELFTPQITCLAAGAVALAGLALILVGRGVAQRRRFAFYLTAGLLAVATVTHLIQGRVVVAAAVPAALGAVLVWRRRLFVVAPGPARANSMLRLAGALLVLDVADGTIGLVLRAGQVRPRLTPGGGAAEAGARLIGQTGPLTITGRFGALVPRFADGPGRGHPRRAHACRTGASRAARSRARDRA
jgi:lysyl-tRNA synthetase, class II